MDYYTGCMGLLLEKKCAVLLLADGTVFKGYGFGYGGPVAGELCFNTSLSGYQEVLTDPSYKGQLVVFTTPHIGNTGTNGEDIESKTGRATGVITRELPTPPANFRNELAFDRWLVQNRIAGIAGVDTRLLVIHLRQNGAQNGGIGKGADFESSLALARKALAKAPVMANLEMAFKAATSKPHQWKEPLWRDPFAASSANSPANPASRRTTKQPAGKRTAKQPTHKRTANKPSASLRVVVIDYGTKHNILRHLKNLGVEVKVAPPSLSCDEILKLKPDGVLLSNGPGDPAATAALVAPTIAELVRHKIPLFGICLGHQLLALSLGAKTEKMHHGHRGSNHPVLDIASGRVEVTSQNHGFVVAEKSLPANIKPSHRSLFDGSLEGIRLTDAPAFSVQYHPESSPGPYDSHHLFRRFYQLMAAR